MKKIFNVNSLISFTEFYSGMVMGDKYEKLYECLLVLLQAEACFYFVHEL